MNFWPLKTYRGYTKAESIGIDGTENSRLYRFDSSKSTKVKTKKKSNTSFGPSENNNFIDSNCQVVVKKERFDLYRIPISKGDSLHSVAMKFGCSVWELKRANRLWGLQDIHALNSLLVPAAKDSYRAELLSSAGTLVPRHEGTYEEAEEDSGGDLATASQAVAASSSAEVDEPVRQLSLRQAMSSESLGDCDAFLRTLDADLEEIKASTCFLKDSLDEVTQYLTVPTVLPPPTQSWYSRLKDVDVDCGMSWRGAVCLVTVTCLLLPALLYLVWYASRSRD